MAQCLITRKSAQKQRLYLFKNGEINTEVVGNFTLYKGTGSESMSIADTIKLSIRRNGAGAVCSANDLTSYFTEQGYKYVYIIFKLDGNFSTVRWGLTDSKEYFPNENSLSGYRQQRVDVKEVKQYFSSFSKNFFYFTLSASGAAGGSVNISEIWLEKE